MNVLAIDTCFGAVSVAIGRDHSGDGFSITEGFERRSTGHAERLVPMIEAQMAEAGLTFRDVDRVAVTLGPGSFTGVRTGIAVARAIRLAAEVEVVGTSSLAVMAQRIFEPPEGEAVSSPIMISVDARRGRLYAQLFGCSALDPLTPPSELTAEAAAELALRFDGIRIAGSGAKLIAEASGEAKLAVLCDDIEPHAGDIARLAARLTPLVDIVPIYIRPPDAKPQGDKRLERAS
jgi:tRNA threonylcarbamoyladenosine biosynthesis protein TsaB